MPTVSRKRVFRKGNSMNIEDQYRVINFNDFGDERGKLYVIEGDGMDIPFDVKRVFYMYDSDDTVVRGQHANKETEFVLINVSGKSKVRVDNGHESRIISLDKPGIGLYITAMLWKDMYEFSADSVLLVLASRHYDAHEYIRDYQEYLQYLKDFEAKKTVSEEPIKTNENEDVPGNE